MQQWLEEHEYESVRQMQGSVSRSCAINPAALEHSNYIDVIKSYRAD
jgi:dihydroorotate dehydrogenase (fumarate)